MTVNNGRQDPEALRAEIQRTRTELGETVHALAARADVKARLKESAAHTTARVRAGAARQTGRVREQAGSTAKAVRRDPVPWAAVAAGVLMAVAVVVAVRGRRR